MRRYIDNWKISFIFLVALWPLLAYGVTQKEMEQARTIAAKAYLRYANDGSGYLDDLNPASMEELESKLKSKEKENIKAFKAIPVPADYKDWDKEKLVKYWAVEAFKNKNLLEKGRGGRLRARSQINKMTITAPSADNKLQAATPVSNVEKEVSPTPTDSLLNDIKNEEKDIIAEDKVEEEDIKIDKATNYTWVYIMALAILVALVIALVVYAANVFKKNGVPGNSKPLPNDYSEEIEHLESTITDKDVEIAMLKKKLESEKNRNTDLKNQLDSLSEEVKNLKAAAYSSVSPVSKDTEIKAENSSPKHSLRSIYLGRANARGIFVRADRTLNVGNSIYLLETTDGFSGTFKVADSPAAWSLALSNPREYLATACTGHDLEDTLGVSKVVTETSGTAIFEGGCWRVIRKARVRYE